MDDRATKLTNALLWLLETRNWARAKLSMAPRDSDQRDVKLYHYLYFSNALDAIDLVRNYLDDAKFPDQVRGHLATSGDFDYARELRGAIIHRGLDPAASGQSGGGHLRFLCPVEIFSSDGRRRHTCSFTYTADLAQALDTAANAAMTDALRDNGLLDPGAHAPDRDGTLAAIGTVRHLPDFAKAWVATTLQGPDWTRIATEVAESRVRNLKGLLSSPLPG